VSFLKRTGFFLKSGQVSFFQTHNLPFGNLAAKMLLACILGTRCMSRARGVVGRCGAETSFAASVISAKKQL
jgi:hypothetical protein